MRQAFFYSILTLAAVAAFAQPTTAEARNHCRGHHRSTSVQFNIGTSGYPQNQTYVVRQYQHVVPGVVVAPGYYTPYSPPQTVIYSAPAYVEHVYVAPAPRPVSLTGFSFGFGLFR